MLIKIRELLARWGLIAPSAPLDDGPPAPPRPPGGDPPRTTPEEARALIEAGRAPDGLRVSGPLDLEAAAAPLKLPAGLEAPLLDLSKADWMTELPPGLRVTTLIVDGCANLTALPGDLRAYEVRARGSGLSVVAPGLGVDYKLVLADCRSLTRLPENLRVSALDLRGCTGLAALPDGLEVDFLDLDGCTSLAGWPARGAVRLGRLSMRGCSQLEALPPWLGPISQLDLSGCARISALPDSLEVSGWIDVAGTGITRLPAGCAGAQLRWRGVPVDERIAFSPETITSAEILAERNAERRRVMLERRGYERFFHDAQATVRDRDTDPGGPRELLVVPLAGDEDLVCVSVNCPSTGRRYVIRVPPGTPTCRHAAAWIAGFDDPDDYRPLIET
jgi:hypothetical protein